MFENFKILVFPNFSDFSSILIIFDLKFGFSIPKYPYGQVLRSVEVSFTSKTSKTSHSLSTP